MKAIEKMGLLKMDFLGLTTLTIIDDCLKLILQTRGETDLDGKIPLEDAETYEKVFHKGQTSGVFQFESTACATCCAATSRTTVEDLTALNALYRPGPIQGGMIDDFIERKWGRKKVDYMLPELERMLKETLGVIVYQEQVMQIANVSPATRWAKPTCCAAPWAKKIASEMDKQRERFMRARRSANFRWKKAGRSST
jgi:DNA polymerase III subunit alpha